MKRTSKITKTLLLLAGASIVALSTQSAHAGFFALREQSAYSQGASFAGASAQTNALSSFFFNPAIITEFEGLTLDANLTAVLPFTDLNTSVANANTGNAVLDATRAAVIGTRQTSGNIGKEALIPSSYASYQFNDKIWFGIAANTPFGLGTRSDPNSLESLSSQEFSALSVNVQPTVAYKFSDRFSIAIGAQVQYIDVEQSAAQLNGSNVELNATDWSAGVIFGATFKPTESTTIGFGYRSQMNVDLEGDIAALNVPNPFIPGAVIPVVGLGRATANLALPDIINVGIKHQFTRRFAGLAQFSWENWSRLQQVNVINAAGATAATFDFNLRDSFFGSIGAEFAATDHLTFRAGVGYETSPTNDEDRTAALPDNTRLWLSAGGTFKLNDHMEADFGATWIRVEGDTPVSNSFQGPATTAGAALGALAGAPIASGTADTNVFIFSVGSRMKF